MLPERVVVVRREDLQCLRAPRERGNVSPREHECKRKEGTYSRLGDRPSPRAQQPLNDTQPLHQLPPLFPLDDTPRPNPPHSRIEACDSCFGVVAV